MNLDETNFETAAAPANDHTTPYGITTNHKISSPNFQISKIKTLQRYLRYPIQMTFSKIYFHY